MAAANAFERITSAESYENKYNARIHCLFRSCHWYLDGFSPILNAASSFPRLIPHQHCAEVILCKRSIFSWFTDSHIPGTTGQLYIGRAPLGARGSGLFEAPWPYQLPASLCVEGVRTYCVYTRSNPNRFVFLPCSNLRKCRGAIPTAKKNKKSRGANSYSTKHYEEQRRDSYSLKL